MKKVLGLALLATLLATPAFAGETFVRNEDSWSNSVTRTDLKLDSKTYSNRYENYNSWADKIYLDGDVTQSCYFCGGTTISYDELTFHQAGANLYGSYYENNFTSLTGTINTTTNAYTDAHETTAGVR